MCGLRRVWHLLSLHVSGTRADRRKGSQFLDIVSYCQVVSRYLTAGSQSCLPGNKFLNSLITREVEYGYIEYISLWIMYLLVQAGVPLGRGGNLFPITVLTHPPCTHACYCFLILFLHPAQLFWTHLLLFRRPVPCVWGEGSL